MKIGIDPAKGKDKTVYHEISKNGHKYILTLHENNNLEDVSENVINSAIKKYENLRDSNEQPK